MSRIFDVFQNPLILLWWLNVPLSWWLNTKLVGKSGAGAEAIRKDSPVLYVLPFRSLSDLLVLYFYCKKLNLPLPVVIPKALQQAGQGGCVYLSKVGLFQPKRDKNAPTPLHHMCVRISESDNLDVQLVPVSIIWGRNPGKQESSLFQLLFPDDEHAGWLQKMFIILAQGRNTVVHFGTPIAMRAQVEAGPNPDQVAIKLRRVLRVHFRTQRNIIVGPKAYDRAQVMRYIFDSHTIQRAIDTEVVKSGQARHKVEQKVRDYLREIAAAKSYSMIRFFEILFTWAWNKIYEGIVVRNMDGLRDIAGENELVYVPCHRSHLDYLVMPYELYCRGFSTPHTAAGINLGFWPLGVILRRGGAFFIRRSIRGNRLYSIIFTEYLNYLIIKGHPIAFFPEGGRSRTGRVLPLKTGMLSMIVNGYLRNPHRPLAFVPMYISYDKVAEVNSYLRELRGAQKKKESIFQLLNIWKVLMTKHGSAYIGVAPPIYLDLFLDAAKPEWRQIKMEELENRPGWLTQVVDELANRIPIEINRAALVSPVSLVSSAILSSPQRAVSLEDLCGYIDGIRKMIAATQPESLHLPLESADQLISYCEKMTPIKRFEYPGGGDVIYLNEIDASLLLYYRNNIAHLYAYPAVLSAYLLHSEEVSVIDAENALRLIGPFLNKDLFLEYSDSEIKQLVQQLFTCFAKMNLVTWNDRKEVFIRAALTAPEYSIVAMFARLISPLLDRYSIGLVMLGVVGEGNCFSKEKFAKELQAAVQRCAAIKGITDPEVSDQNGMKNFFEVAKSLKLISANTNSEGYTVTSTVSRYAATGAKIIDQSILQSLQRLDVRDV